MPQLMIKYAYDNWRAYISNSDVEYYFAGANREEQIVRVRQLQESMRVGAGTVDQNASEIFSDRVGFDPDELAQQLFGTTDGLVFEGDTIFTASEGEVLLDVLEDAAYALGLAL